MNESIEDIYAFAKACVNSLESMNIGIKNTTPRL